MARNGFKVIEESMAIDSPCLLDSVDVWLKQLEIREIKEVLHSC